MGRTIVLSSERFFRAAPGPAKNDGTSLTATR
jgi:hypothetical protein